MSLPSPRPLRPLRFGALGCLLATRLLAADGWIPLFDGKSLDGWTANESPASWAIEDGALVTRGPRSHLFYSGPVASHDFRNFEFSAEVMTTPGSNSGIYIHTNLVPTEQWPAAGYECQVINTSRPMEGGYEERKMTGSIYAIRNTWRAPVKDDTWFEYRIRVSGKTIQTFINGELICQYTEPAGAWRASSKPGRYLGSGTFAFQCHDPGSVVRYRNIRARLLPDDAPSLEEPIADRELDQLITQPSDSNIALIDLGIEPGSAALVEAQAAAARFYGITLGYTLPADQRALSRLGASAPVVIFNDRVAPPTAEALQAAKSAGAKIAFSSGGDTRLDPERLRRRLRAIRDAKLGWRDFWAPGQ